MGKRIGKEYKDMINIADTAARAAVELSQALLHVCPEELGAFMQEILKAKKIYVAGAGRSLLMLRCFAMRLMHVGLTSYVTGDTTTPAFESGDLMIIASGSGETSGLIAIAEKVKRLNGTLAVITIQAETPLGSRADVLVKVPAYTDKIENGAMKKTILPGGSLFEQSVLFLADAMILPLAEKMGVATDRAFSRHANLE